MQTRAKLIEELRSEPDGVDAAALACRLGLHPNTVRWHLGALTASGSVTATAEQTGSRGRPHVLYRLEPGGDPGTRDEYRLLAHVLSGTVMESTNGAAAAEQAGRRWGRYLVERPLPLVPPSDEQAVESVTGLLHDQGFAPETSQREIRMHRCPFHDLAETQPQIVCAVHRGLIDGALEELGSTLEIGDLEVFARPDLCIARLRQAR